jgi:hypothetical protein
MMPETDRLVWLEIVVVMIAVIGVLFAAAVGR